jgi:hypothetical protein
VAKRTKAEKQVTPVNLDEVQDHPSPQGDWVGWCDQQDNAWTAEVRDYDTRE